MRRFFTEKETTAYHEAGHATIAYLRKVRLIKITIEPDFESNSTGTLVYSNKLIEEDEQKLLDQKNIDRLKTFMAVAFGGLASEFIYTGVKNLHSASADLYYIEKIAKFVYPPKEKEDELTKLLQEVIDELKIADHWNLIEKLAWHLLNQKTTLSGKETIEILKDSSQFLKSKEHFNIQKNSSN